MIVVCLVTSWLVIKSNDLKISLQDMHHDEYDNAYPEKDGQNLSAS